MNSVAELLMAVLVVWLTVTTVTSCIALWLLWKVAKSEISIPDVHKNKVTKEALRSLK